MQVEKNNKVTTVVAFQIILNLKKWAKEVAGLIKLQVKKVQATLLPHWTCIGSKGLILWSFANNLMPNPRQTR